jgi:mono/diheme cytochrome c family protein
MYNQPRCKPLGVSRFFADGACARPLVPGTIWRGFTDKSEAFYTGRQAATPAYRPPLGGDRTDLPPEVKASPLPLPAQAPGDSDQLVAWLAITAAEAAGGAVKREPSLYLDALPIPLDLPLLERGQRRFDIYCAPCHDRLGTGEGMIVRKGFTRPPSFHTERLRSAKLGHFFDVMTNGFGAMPSYAVQISPEDRWAIVGYIRALQWSQWTLRTELPAKEQGRFGTRTDSGPKITGGLP